MTILRKNSLLFAAVETTAGTAQTIGGSNYVRAMDVKLDPEGLRMIERSAVASGSQGMLKSLYGGSLQAITATCEFAPGDGTATIPEHDALLRAAGFAVSTVNDFDPITDTAGTTGDATRYALQSGVNTDTVTASFAEDGIRRSIKGARASSFSFDFTTGASAKFSTTLVGKEDTSGDVSLPSFIMAAKDPLVVKDAVLNIGGNANFIVEAVTVDMGLDLQMLSDVTDVAGYALPRLVNRAISVTLAPEKVLFATRDFWQNLKDGTAISLSFAIGKSRIDNASNEGDLTLTMPQLRLTNVVDGDRSGITTSELTFEAYKTGNGNNELELTFS